MSLTEVAVVPTIGAVATATVAVQRAFRSPTASAGDDAARSAPKRAGADADKEIQGGGPSEEAAG